MNGSSPPTRSRAKELGRFLEIQNLGLNLSFAVAFLLAAAGGLPTLRTLVLVVIAFVAARNAGHSFNRWADRRLDAANPRTRDRALVTGRYSPRFAIFIVALSAAILLAAAYLLNWLAFVLAPVALAVLFGYSFTKRYTAVTTVVLGLAEAITPAAAYVAVTGALPAVSLVAVGGILLWGTAFETIHSLGDLEADRRARLHSIPLALGIGRSVRLVPALHAAALALLAIYADLAGFGLPVYVALVVMAIVVALTDRRLALQPTTTALPFRAHFLLGAIFLLGIVVALFVPGARF